MGNPIDLSSIGNVFGSEPEPTRPARSVEQPTKREPNFTHTKETTPSSSALPKATVQLNSKISLEARARLEEHKNRTNLTIQELLEKMIFGFK